MTFKLLCEGSRKRIVSLIEPYEGFTKNNLFIIIYYNVALDKAYICSPPGPRFGLPTASASTLVTSGSACTGSTVYGSLNLQPLYKVSDTYIRHIVHIITAREF
jgi:hypothetical protein